MRMKKKMTATQKSKTLLDPITADFKFKTPPERNRTKILAAFRETGLYSEAFLKDLERGIKRSNHFTD